MEGNLDTTNTILLVMAIVSVLEALLLIGLGVGGFLIYRRVMQVVSDLEARQIAPLREKVDAILTDVKAVTARVSSQTERVDHAISGTIDRVDDTAERMKSTVRDKVNRTVGMVRGVRAVLMSLLTSESRPKPPAPAAGTA
jgi:sensor histidine kinase regulating citrate/malate metabolism